MAATNVIGGKGNVTANGTVLASFLVEPQSSVTIDRRNAARRACSIQLTTGELVGSSRAVIPSSPSDLFAPYGNELTLYFTSIVNGVETDTQVGVFLITDPQIDDSGSDLGMTVQGSDRALAYTRAGFTDTYTIAAGTNVGTAIRALLSSRAVAFTQQFNLTTVTAVTPNAPTIYQPGDDPWGKALELATAAGCELFVDRFGAVTLIPVPDPSSGLVAASYIEGNTNTAVHLKRNLSNAKVANYVIRDGQGTGVAAPVRGVAKDTNPNSPTYINGPYGQVVDYQSSSLYTTQAQAQAAANAQLLLNLGSVETSEIDALHDPLRDVDDVVTVQRARAGLPTATKYVLDAISLSFDPGTAMQMTARAIAGIT